MGGWDLHLLRLPPSVISQLTALGLTCSKRPTGSSPTPNLLLSGWDIVYKTLGVNIETLSKLSLVALREMGEAMKEEEPTLDVVWWLEILGRCEELMRQYDEATAGVESPTTGRFHSTTHFSCSEGENSVKTPHQEFSSTGNRNLDTLLRGGLKIGEVTEVYGAPTSRAVITEFCCVVMANCVLNHMRGAGETRILPEVEESGERKNISVSRDNGPHAAQIKLEEGGEREADGAVVSTTADSKQKKQMTNTKRSSNLGVFIHTDGELDVSRLGKAFGAVLGRDNEMDEDTLFNLVKSGLSCVEVCSVSEVSHLAFVLREMSVSENAPRILCIDSLSALIASLQGFNTRHFISSLIASLRYLAITHKTIVLVTSYGRRISAADLDWREHDSLLPQMPRPTPHLGEVIATRWLGETLEEVEGGTNHDVLIYLPHSLDAEGVKPVTESGEKHCEASVQVKVESQPLSKMSLFRTKDGLCDDYSQYGDENLINLTDDTRYTPLSDSSHQAYLTHPVAQYLPDHFIRFTLTLSPRQAVPAHTWTGLTVDGGEFEQLRGACFEGCEPLENMVRIHEQARPVQ
eukprot:GHVN01050673.1.p1 GENE.GHVN01050673.1~~GHVN01050673.1.p1  ORF type:complete len:576 (-),score=91.41 GHVN01050673.1:1928-3655(-)